MENMMCHRENDCPDKMKYFSQISVEEFLELPTGHPDIGHIVTVVVDCHILSLKAINTMKGLSCEGQFLSGKKLAVTLKLKQKILYVTDKGPQSVHVLEHDCYHSCYVVIPCLMEGTDPDLLIKHKILQCTVNVEDVFVKKTSKRNMFKNLSLLITVNFARTYELCYAIHTCKSARLYLAHNDGSHVKRLTDPDCGRDSKPLWSPQGQEIAYISDNGCHKLFKLYSLKTGTERVLSLVAPCHSIGSYSWASDGARLLFSGNRSDCREIFAIDTNNTELRQLTRGGGRMESYKPKCSPCGGKIAFLRSQCGIADLWMVDETGLDCIRLTSCGGIQDFDWLPDGKGLLYVCSRYDKQDQICLVQLENAKTREIFLEEPVHLIRKLKASPDGSLFAFIATQNGAEAIYTCRMADGCLERISDNAMRFEIYDFVWSADSDRIYFSASGHDCLGLYDIALENGQQRQLVNATGSKIELAYRGRLG